MSQQLWVVAGVLTAAFLLWFTKYAIRAIAAQVVSQIGDSLQDRWKQDITEAILPLQEELSYNGGTSVKDMVRRIERQLEQFLAG